MRYFIKAIVLAPFWLLMGDFSWVGAIVGADANKDAANTARDAQNDATVAAMSEAEKTRQMQQKMYDEQMGLFREGIASNLPYSQTGNMALPYLQSAVLGGNRSIQVPKYNPDGTPMLDASGKPVLETYSGEFTPGESPAAKWQLQQGTKMLNRQLAGRGMAGGGMAINRLSELQQGITANDYNTQYGRLLDLLSKGAGANASTASALSSTANAAGNFANQQGSLGANLMNLYQTNGNNQANNALLQGNNMASLYSGMGGAASNTLNTGIQFNNMMRNNGWYGSNGSSGAGSYGVLASDANAAGAAGSGMDWGSGEWF